MKRFILAAVAVLSVGCAAGPASRATKASQPSSAAPTTTEDGYVLTRITDPALPKGKCGMILWTLEQERPAPIFKFLADEGAALAINNEPLQAARTSALGAVAFGVSEQQDFVDENGAIKINVNVRFGLGFDGGAYLQSGLVSIETLDGWRFVTPAAGIAGCRAA